MKKFLVLVLWIVVAYQLNAQTQGSLFKEAVHSNRGVVACYSKEAAKVGIDVLNRGGNAVDAAIAMVFAIGVTRPDQNGIGGGGFLLFRSKTGEVKALDFRETAPMAVVDTTFKDTGMHKDYLESVDDEVGSGHMVVGVPGTVRGMAEALKKLGSKNFTLAQLISSGAQPSGELPIIFPKKIPYAYELARDGIEISGNLSVISIGYGERFSYYEETEKIYGRIPAFFTAQEPFRQAGLEVPSDLLFKQEDYAKSLKIIMDCGPEAFYNKYFICNDKNGMPITTIAEMIINDMDENNLNKIRVAEEDHPYYRTDTALMTANDLKSYQPIWRKPLSINYRNYQVYAMPPPTSGGITTLQILNLLEHFPLNPNDANWKQSSANHFHVLAEAQKIAWADLNAFIGDPDFVNVPTQELISKSYAQKRYLDIKLKTATPLDKIGGIGQVDRHGTMHLSVIDSAGNAVAITNTINHPFGSAVVAPGTGFLLNDELTDFNMDAPGTANEPNGGKRPRSSNSPTIVVQDGKPILVVGGSGGSKIIMGVIQSIVNVVDFKLPIDQAVDDKRIDAVAWYSSKMQSKLYKDSVDQNYLGIEDKRVNSDVMANLKARGHKTVGKRDGPRRIGIVDDYVDNYTGTQSDYHYNPLIMAVGYNPNKKWNEATCDPRVGVYSGDYGASAQPEKEEDSPPSNLTEMQRKAGIAEVKELNSLRLSVTVTPNPSTQYFTLQVKSNDSKIPISVRVTDMLGKLVERKAGLVAGQTLQIGQTYTSGIYQVEAIQGRERTVKKIIKQTQ